MSWYVWCVDPMGFTRYMCRSEFDGEAPVWEFCPTDEIKLFETEDLALAYVKSNHHMHPEVRVIAVVAELSEEFWVAASIALSRHE